MKKLLIPTSFKVVHTLTVIVRTAMFETATYLFSYRKRGAVRIRKLSHVQYLYKNTITVTRTQH